VSANNGLCFVNRKLLILTTEGTQLEPCVLVWPPMPPLSEGYGLQLFTSWRKFSTVIYGRRLIIMIIIW